MYSKKEIRKAFEVMDLSSEQQRKLFEKTKITTDESEQQYLFIISGNNSEKAELRLESAELE